MLIADTFNTRIQDRIEPVVKVSDHRPAVMLAELENLVITRQWEQYIRTALDAYTEAADREDEQGIGIWISGFFGSGKSLLIKALGVLLQGGTLEGKSVHAVFLSRIATDSPDRPDIERYLKVLQRKLTTSYVGGNLHAMQSASDDPLALVAFKLFANQRGYTKNWPLAWAVEYQLDSRGLHEAFRERVCQLTGMGLEDWEEVAADAEFYSDHLYRAAAEVLPDHFREGVEAVSRAVTNAAQNGITPNQLIERFRRWCERQDANGKRHKLLLQLDEMGQWIASGNTNARTMQVQALAEQAAEQGAGRIWLAVTAHGDIQALQHSVQQEQYAKINQRFDLKFKLSNEDISRVVEERLLRKTQAARVYLKERFEGRSGELTDIGSITYTQRTYPIPTPTSFALFYPYLPWTVAVIPDVVKGIAQAAGRDEALTGSNRTMIGVVQGAIIETSGLLNSPVGQLIGLADLYEQLHGDMPVETKTDLNRIKDTVEGATNFTVRVARALFLLGQSGYIDCNLDNISRAVVSHIDDNLPTLCKQVKPELDRLVKAGYAKLVGDLYTFLSTQQRTFQDKVRARQEELRGNTYDLIQALKEYDGEEAFRFDKVVMPGQPREMALRFELDGRAIRNPNVPVSVRVFSPFQRGLDPQLNDDTVQKQHSAQDPDNFLFRMGEVVGLYETLALTLATAEIAERVISANTASGAELEVARNARQVDLASYKSEVRRLLSQSVRTGTLFFRGTSYPLAEGESAAQMVRNTLSQLMPSIYARSSEVPHRLVNEEVAVKAALSGNTTNSDLKALGVFKADGTLNEVNALISAIVLKLPLAEQDQPPVSADNLRNEFERPPYGWDGNCVKVGLALLLRNSSCRLIENSRTIIDPQDSDTVLALTKETRFRNLRVQGIRSDLDISALQQIRGLLETTFNLRSPRLTLVAATLNNVLGEKLTELAKIAGEIESWAIVARCPLPLEFEAGRSLIDELLNTAATNIRLVRYRDVSNQILTLNNLVQDLAQFRQERSSEFGRVRDFFQQMVNAELSLEELRRFISDWRTLSNERSLTNPSRWNELLQSYRAAEAAISRYLESEREVVSEQLAQLENGLPARLKVVGVPPEDVGAEALRIAQVVNLNGLKVQLNTSDLQLSDLRSIRAGLTNAQMDIQQQMSELRTRFQPVATATVAVMESPSNYSESTETPVRLNWRELVGSQVTINSVEELEVLLEKIRQSIAPVIEQQNKMVVVE